MEASGCCSAVSLFSLSSALLPLMALLLVLVLLYCALKPCCDCPVCSAYLTGQWNGEFHNLADWYAALLEKSPTHTIHNHLLGNIITANPKNVEHMLVTRFDNYPKGKAFSAILHDLLGRGIFNVDGELWRSQRKMASFELGSANVRGFVFGLVSDEIRQRLVPVMEAAERSGAGLDLQDVLRRFSFDCICKASFGVDPRCLELSLPLSEFAHAFDSASQMSARRATTWTPYVWKAKRLLRVGSERELRDAVRKTHALAEEVIRRRRASVGSSKHRDLLSRFMGSTKDDRLLRDIVVSFLLAGRDTVAAALTAFFWLVSCHPHVENSILDEICRVASPLGEFTKETLADASEITLEHKQLKDLHYLQAAISESMRLYPPVQFDSKYAAQDDVLPDGTVVKKGTRVTYHPYAMGRMESIWGPDCRKFQPEKWLKNGVFVPDNPFKYPVFQAGSRVCLGKEIAFMQMKSVAVTILWRFTIETKPCCRQLKFSPGLTANISGGLPVIVKPRTWGREPTHKKD
ncbi:cytochrome P450 94C1-like [Nymphaea colorata]|uniref:Cytochrome P450 n=1 Tax=Nymphaea colorata TaxID=210225 RepID=A0A5K0V824_9MAGN|nr:cytochrome P450 94C1-like [Nymphaea colorata]